MEEDSKWVAAAAVPHGWSVGGPGPHPGKRTQAPRKVPVWGARWKQPLSFLTEGGPGPQEDIDPHLLPLLD